MSKSKCSVIILVLLLSSFRPYPLHVLREPGGTRGVGRSLAHSHNDYEQWRPLQDALSARFDSVEADVWLKDDVVRVSHLGWTFTGTLKELYLDPLEKITAARGSVHGDGKPFFLWIDIKSRGLAIARALAETLRGYRFTERGVTVVLTGNPEAKIALAAAFPAAEHDGWRVEDSDPPASNTRWKWYSLNWFSVMRWAGEGEIATEERDRLVRLVRTIHGKGRRLRFWGAPERPEIWRLSEEAGVDLIGTDDIRGLSRYFGRSIATQ
jgi:hypothetical protein